MLDCETCSKTWLDGSMLGECRCPISKGMEMKIITEAWIPLCGSTLTVFLPFHVFANLPCVRAPHRERCQKRISAMVQSQQKESQQKCNWGTNRPRKMCPFFMLFMLRRTESFLQIGSTVTDIYRKIPLCVHCRGVPRAKWDSTGLMLRLPRRQQKRPWTMCWLHRATQLSLPCVLNCERCDKRVLPTKSGLCRDACIVPKGSDAPELTMTYTNSHMGS